jgi:hypothetical protein
LLSVVSGLVTFIQSDLKKNSLLTEEWHIWRL